MKPITSAETAKLDAIRAKLHVRAGDYIRHKPITMTDNAGNAYRVTFRQIAPTLRYEVIVEGEVVGFGFATRDEAYDRAYDAIREDRWAFSRGGTR